MRSNDSSKSTLYLSLCYSSSVLFHHLGALTSIILTQSISISPPSTFPFPLLPPPPSSPSPLPPSSLPPLHPLFVT